MIAKISNGSKFTGLAAYLHGPGRSNEHTYGLEEGGQVIGGNLLCEGDRDGYRWARDMNAAAGQRPDIEKPVWHMSLRAAPDDPRLSDEQWRDIVQEHAEQMGWARQPWVMVRHGEDHVHVVVSRVDFDGKVWSRRDDRYKAREVCQDVELRYRLRSTALDGRQQARSRTRQHTAKLTQGEFARSERTGRTPERVSLANVVRAARDHAVRIGGGREAFEAALTENGVQWRANVASTGRMNGYSFHDAGHVDAAGKPVWLKASDLDRGLSWGRLSKDLAPRPVQVRVPPVEPKRFLERASSYEARVQAASVAAHEKHRAKSAVTMQRQISAGSVQGGLFWTTRRVKKTAALKQWTINAQQRAEQRANQAQIQAIRRANGSHLGPLRGVPAPGPGAVVQGLSHLDRARRDLDPNRTRGRGMSR